MGKVAKLKKQDKAVLNSNTRAARRQPSPQPLKATKSTAEDDNSQPWLYHTTASAGVTKKAKPKKLTRNQRLRLEKGFQNAERNVSKLEKRREDSKRRGRTIGVRSAEWEEINGEAPVVKHVVTEVEEGDASSAAVLDKPSSWVKQLVDVEIQEAIQEIEGFELPSLGTGESFRESKDPIDGTAPLVVVQAMPNTMDPHLGLRPEAVDDIDEIS